MKGQGRDPRDLNPVRLGPPKVLLEEGVVMDQKCLYIGDKAVLKAGWGGQASRRRQVLGQVTSALGCSFTPAATGEDGTVTLWGSSFPCRHYPAHPSALASRKP